MTWAIWELSAGQLMVSTHTTAVQKFQVWHAFSHVAGELLLVCAATRRLCNSDPQICLRSHAHHHQSIDSHLLRVHHTNGPMHLCSAALGLGAVHCINAESQRYRARKQRNSAGAEKWMDIRMWDSPPACIQAAKAAGYQVLATHFDSKAVSIHEVDWTQPTAVILGNEREGNDLRCNVILLSPLKLAGSTVLLCHAE